MRMAFGCRYSNSRPLCHILPHVQAYSSLGAGNLLTDAGVDVPTAIAARVAKIRARDGLKMVTDAIVAQVEAGWFLVNRK